MPTIEVTDEELAMLISALEEAAFFRDARSNVVRSAVRRRDRRIGSDPSDTEDAGAEHVAKARAYGSLAARLRQK